MRRKKFLTPVEFQTVLRQETHHHDWFLDVCEHACDFKMLLCQDARLTTSGIILLKLGDLLKDLASFGIVEESRLEEPTRGIRQTMLNTVGK
jgi:hypothetical protein